MTQAIPAERTYTNGRIRVRPEQIEYLDQLLHIAWVDLSRARAKLKAGEPDAELLNHLNREMRLIQAIQQEVKRTRKDMGV